ncbi:MAG TPA: zf-HC2 domain-containing protein [Acidobacteriota bacterium]|nr:zf-HC2 domain-containing protein [Acidobacteriota bacterium]
MNCARFETLLSDYLEERLDATVRRAVEAHLADCPRCGELLRDVGELVTQLRELPEVEAPESLTEAILMRTSGKPERWSFKREFIEPVLRSLRSPRYAFGTLIMFAFFSLMVNVLGPGFSASSASWLNPGSLVGRAEELSGEAYRTWKEFVEFRRRVVEEIRLMREDLFGRLDYHLITMLFKSYQESVAQQQEDKSASVVGQANQSEEEHHEQ